MKILYILFIFISFSFAQDGSFQHLYFSKYTRAIGMGNTFTGVADDIEALHYNPAGISSSDNYSAILTVGDGTPQSEIFDSEYSSYKFSVILPIPQLNGIFAFDLDKVNSEFSFPTGDTKFMASVYSLFYSRKITSQTYIGINASYYDFNSSSNILNSPDDFNDQCVDIGLSGLYRFENVISNNDNLSFGIFINNILDSKIKSGAFNERKIQFLRSGFSYKIPFTFYQIPLSYLIAFDLSYLLYKYDFYTYQPNLGMELEVFNFLFLRYGRENEEQIKKLYESTYLYPATTFGFGVAIPVSKLLNFKNSLTFVFDYSYKDWDKVSKKMEESFEYQRSTFSIKINFGL